MATAVSTAFAIAAVAWFAMMATAIVGVLRIAPRGQRMRTYNQLSMWKFGEIRTALGTAVEPHLLMMKRGAYAFLILFAVVVVVAVASIVITSMNPVAA